MKWVAGAALVIAVLLVSGVSYAISPNDSFRTCGSARGQFVDKNGDGIVNHVDWRQMDVREKGKQAVWNIETMCQETTAENVSEMVNALDAALTG